MEISSGAVSPRAALELIAEGKPQEVVIDPTAMLNMVMRALGSKQMPLFTEVPCGIHGKKLRIKLHVSSSKYHESRYVSIEGFPSTDFLVAEHSAVANAINYLNDRHHVRIIDYSSQIINGLNMNSLFEKFSGAMTCLHKIIHNWHLTVDTTRQLAMTLENKDAADQVDQTYERWDRYASMKDYINNIVQIYGVKVDESRSKANELDECIINYKKQYEDDQLAVLSQGHLQTITIQPKDVLDYVLKYLGSPKADYSNTFIDDTMMKGIAKFFITPLNGIKYCGNLEIPGSGQDSVAAEQNAAYQTLLFMEDRYELKVIDLNYKDRLKAEFEHKDVVLVLDQVLFQTKKIKKNWLDMLKSLKSLKDSYSMDAFSVYPPTADERKIQAYEYCSDESKHLEAHVAMVFEDCASMFEEMENLQHMVDGMKKAI